MEVEWEEEVKEEVMPEGEVTMKGEETSTRALSVFIVEQEPSLFFFPLIDGEAAHDLCTNGRLLCASPLGHCSDSVAP